MLRRILPATALVCAVFAAPSYAVDRLADVVGDPRDRCEPLAEDAGQLDAAAFAQCREALGRAPAETDLETAEGEVRRRGTTSVAGSQHSDTRHHQLLPLLWTVVHGLWSDMLPDVEQPVKRHRHKRIGSATIRLPPADHRGLLIEHESAPSPPRAFRSINRTNRSQQVREQLEAALVRGEFKPGERLPPERELVETFGVSRVSVREALRSLEALGMVRVEPGKGCFVVDALSNSSVLFGRWIALHGVELLDVLNVRGALDGLAAAEAADHATPELVARLQEICASFETLAHAEDEPTRLKRLTQLDVEFHELIAQASASPLLEQLVGELDRYLIDTRVPLALGSRPADSAREHRAIADAIAAGDADAARASMIEHVESVRRELRNLQPERA